MGAWSRFIVGYALSRRIDARLGALARAIEGRDPGLVFLDRGGRLGVLVDADLDQVAIRVVAACQIVERLDGEIPLNDLALARDAVGSVPIEKTLYFFTFGLD